MLAMVMAIGGGSGLLLGHQLELVSSTNMLISMGLTFAMRMVSVYLGWHLSPSKFPAVSEPFVFPGRVLIFNTRPVQ